MGRRLIQMWGGPGQLIGSTQTQSPAILGVMVLRDDAARERRFCNAGVGKKPQSQRYNINISERTELFNYDELKDNCYWFNSGTSAVYEIPSSSVQWLTSSRPCVCLKGYALRELV